MLNVATLVMVAAAVVIAMYSGSILLALAAICGACAIAALMNGPAETPGGHHGINGMSGR